LEPRPDPDEVVVHTRACRSCGGDLWDAPVVGEERRQVFDLPPIELLAVEHRAQRRACGCGVVRTAAFPPDASASICYRPGVAALGASLLLARQHLPVERAAECLADWFGAPVSTGWLAWLLPTADGKLDGFLAVARERLRAAEVAHFDETGGRVAAKLRWIHVAATDSWTLYHLDERRGTSAMDAAGVLPGFTGVAVHDGHTPYRKYGVVHALCNAHHLRELAGIAELTGQDWPTRPWPTCWSRSTSPCRPRRPPGRSRCRHAGGPRSPAATTAWSSKGSDSTRHRHAPASAADPGSARPPRC